LCITTSLPGGTSAIVAGPPRLEAKGHADFLSHHWDNDKFKSKAVSVFADLGTAKALPVLLETLRTGSSHDRAFACRVLSALFRGHRPPGPKPWRAAQYSGRSLGFGQIPLGHS
jgi:hypothetical protein